MSRSCTPVKPGGIEIDLALFADVLKRHRKVVFVGVALTVALSVLAYVRISPSGISYRSGEVWSNQATLVLTQDGAPELRSVPSGSLADTNRFAQLVDVYAALATSDPVIEVLRRRGLLTEEGMQDGAIPITASALVSTVGGGTTPILTISATAKSGAEATTLTVGATKALVDYVRSRQLEAKIPLKDRVQLRVVKRSGVPTLANARSKALPVLVFLAGLIATLAVAFTRDNLARRERAAILTTVPSQSEPDSSNRAGHGRATLEPVSRADSDWVPERDSDAAARHAPQAGAAASASIARSSSRWAAGRGESQSS